MQITFRFRIHRNASCFSDKCSMDLFVLSDGSVRGTVRDITEQEVGFMPVEIKVDPIVAAEMKELFENTKSTLSSPWINVAYGEFGCPSTTKHLSPPTKELEQTHHAQLWERCVLICNMCLHKYQTRNE